MTVTAFICILKKSDGTDDVPLTPKTSSTYNNVCTYQKVSLIMNPDDPHFLCGIGPAFEVIGGKWKAALLWELQGRTRRFGELKRLLPGISEKMLIQQLRELAADGLVLRVVRQTVPPHVEYSLTPWGESLNVALGPIADWGTRYAQERGR
jgi:DNA-binding HxlR family transcriptional regulator